MSLEKISNSTLEEALVSRLPLRPTAVSRYGAAMTGEEVRAAFDRSAKLLAERLNQVIAILTGEGEGVGGLPLGEERTLGEVLAALRADVDGMAALVSSIPERLAIPAGAVTEEKLANGAVTGTKLANGAVTDAKLADGTVSGKKLGTASVTSDKLATNAVTVDKIAAGAVTGAKLANGAVTSAKLADGAVTLAKMNSAELDRRYAARPTAASRILATASEKDESGLPKVTGLGYVSKGIGKADLQKTIVQRDDNGCVWMEDPAAHPLTEEELSLWGGYDRRGVPKSYVDRALENGGLQKAVEVLSGTSTETGYVSANDISGTPTVGSSLSGYNTFWFAGKYWKAGIAYTVYSDHPFCYYDYMTGEILAVGEVYGNQYRLTVVPTAGSPFIEHPYCDLAFYTTKGIVAYYTYEKNDPVSITPVHNTEYRVGACQSLTLSVTAPTAPDAQLAFDLIYAEKDAPLTLDGDTVVFRGDSVTDGVFTPEEGCRYHIAFRYDGTAVTALVSAFAAAGGEDAA